MSAAAEAGQEPVKGQAKPEAAARFKPLAILTALGNVSDGGLPNALAELSPKNLEVFRNVAFDKPFQRSSTTGSPGSSSAAT